MSRTRLLVGAAALGVVLGLVGLTWEAFDRGWLRLNYPEDRYPVRGVDISHHNGPVDWVAARGAGMTFAYVKATEGGDFVDPRFSVNWREARAAGLAVGAYHFFSFCKDGLTQARNFMTVVPRERDALPPAIDLELGGNCSTTPTAGWLSVELQRMIGTLRAARGAEPVLYVTRELHDAYAALLPATFAGSPLWVRDVYGSPTWVGERKWTFWQYANRGRIPGATGPVDLDVFGGDVEAWATFRPR